jgi:hypothetical protein
MRPKPTRPSTLADAKWYLTKNQLNYYADRRQKRKGLCGIDQASSKRVLETFKEKGYNVMWQEQKGLIFSCVAGHV